MSVYNKLLHEKELRLLGGILGAALMASAINLFIVPQGFYAGGAYGLCQVIRTLLVTRAVFSSSWRGAIRMAVRKDGFPAFQICQSERPVASTASLQHCSVKPSHKNSVT